MEAYVLEGAIVVTLNVSQTFQDVIGFGGAFTDAVGYNINQLSEGARQNFIRSYFDTNGSIALQIFPGLEYTLGRVPIASCDFSTHVYSYDDVDGDLDLKNFSLTEDDFKFKIPLIQQAQALTGGQVKLFGSPWSSPGWMKTTGDMIGNGGLKGDYMGQYYKTWANYFVK